MRPSNILGRMFSVSLFLLLTFQQSRLSGWFGERGEWKKLAIVGRRRKRKSTGKSFGRKLFLPPGKKGLSFFLPAEKEEEISYNYTFFFLILKRSQMKSGSSSRKEEERPDFFSTSGKKKRKTRKKAFLLPSPDPRER